MGAPIKLTALTSAGKLPKPLMVNISSSDMSECHRLSKVKEMKPHKDSLTLIGPVLNRIFLLGGTGSSSSGRPVISEQLVSG